MNSDHWLEIILTFYNSITLPDIDVEKYNNLRGFPVNMTM